MRMTVTMPLETLISIIQRAREFEPGEEGAIEVADLEDEELELAADEEEDEDEVDEDEEGDDGDAVALAAEDLSDEIDDEDDDAAEEDDESDDEEEEELDELLAGLSNEELAEVLALAWVGGGEYEAANWPQALEAARALPDDEAVDYLVDQPNLGDLIEAALGQLGYAAALSGRGAPP